MSGEAPRGAVPATHAAAATGIAIVTRPGGQSTALMAALDARGVTPFEFPLIEIQPLADAALLDAALVPLTRYALVIFVSPNAVACAFDRLREPWPASVPVAVLGPGSLAALARYGVRPQTHRVIAPAGALSAAPAGDAARAEVDGDNDAEPDAVDPRRLVASDTFAPPRFDSEALLEAIGAAFTGPVTGPVTGSVTGSVAGSVTEPVPAAPAGTAAAVPFAALAGTTVLLVRGDGGRELLADALTTIGARVEAVTAYRRGVPQPSSEQWEALRQLWDGPQAPVWLLTSSEGVRNLDTLARKYLNDDERAALKRAPVVAPHARIAESARAAGFDSITVSGAGDINIADAMLAALRSARPTVSSSVPLAAEQPPSASMTEPTARETPAASPAATASRSAAASTAAASKPARAGLLTLWLVVLILALATAGGGYALTRYFQRTLRELETRNVNSDAQLAQARALSQQALTATHQFDTQLAALSGKLADAQNQQQALENMYQDLARNRDDWTLSEIEQMLTTASQQLQLTGNVQLALFALQSADARLATGQAPQMLAVRRAIEQDIDKLKAAPTVDLTGLALKLDNAIEQIDHLPLNGELTTPPGAAASDSAVAAGAAGATSASAASAASAATASIPWQNWWNHIAQGAMRTLAGLIQVRRIGATDTMLVAPDQEYYLRANLKLRLLAARVALLSRNGATMHADLNAAHAALARYFDPNSKQVQAVSGLVDQVNAATTSVPLPDLSTSLNAVHQYKSRG